MSCVMRRVSRLSLGVLIGATILFHAPLRRTALVVLRAPFVVLKTAASTLLLLPRVPELSGENARLRADTAQLSVEVTRLREQTRQTEQIAALIAAAPSSRGVVAAVLGRSLLPTQHTVLLDKGRRQGLAVGAAVVERTGVVGRLVELGPSTALVMLLTDPESRVSGIIERSRETGLLTGLGRGQCAFTYLDEQADIAEGDRIVTAGLGGTFPKGLPLGTVVRVVRDAASGSATAFVEPTARLGRLEEVLCLPVSSEAGGAEGADAADAPSVSGRRRWTPPDRRLG